MQSGNPDVTKRGLYGLIGLLIALLIFCCIAYLAYWIITKFFPEPMRVIALAVIGVVLLIVLLSYVGGYIPAAHIATLR